MPIFILILGTQYLRKATKGRANRYFIMVNIMSILVTLADIFTEGLGKNPVYRESHILFLNFCEYFYFLVRNATLVVYILFLYSYMRMGYRLRKNGHIHLLLIPYYFLAMYLLANPSHHQIFTYTAARGYERGPGVIFLYTVAFFYGTYGAMYLVHYRKFASPDKIISLMSLYLITFVAIVIQLYYPALMVEMFSTAFGFLVIVLVVLRPEETIDSSVGLLGWKAYQDELWKIGVIHHPVQIVSIRLLNGWKVRSYLGEEKYNAYIARVAGEIEYFWEIRKVRMDIYYEAPGALYLIFDESHREYNVMDELSVLYNTVMLNTEEYRENGVELDAHMCLISYPEDLDSAIDIIRLGHDFCGLMPNDKRFVRAADIIGTAGYAIGNQLDTILQRAIREQGFEMYYQPIFDLKERRFKSAEALIRLKDKQFGSISPAYFIPAAESRGLILAIGDFVLDSVYRFISENDLEAMGVHYIEINLSVGQIMQKNLPDKIRMLQEKYNVRPEQVNFEIVESTYDEIGNLAEHNIRELSEMGYTFSLDDYGTGYSNIQRVSTLPLDIVKIDKSMVDAMGTEKGRSILKNTVHMMKDINKELVIEGVESEELVKELMGMDCDFIQGFYFSKPLPGGKFLEFLKEAPEKIEEWRETASIR